MLESAAPAWIQAIGSIAAIFAAAEIGRRQARAAIDLEAKKRAAAEVQKLKIVMALMARAHGLSDDICKAFATAQFSDFDQVGSMPFLVEIDSTNMTASGTTARH